MGGFDFREGARHRAARGSVSPSWRAICEMEKMPHTMFVAVRDQRMLPAEAPQRLEHVPDAGGFHVGERDDLDLRRWRHDVADAELVAAQAAFGGDAASAARRGGRWR